MKLHCVTRTGLRMLLVLSCILPVSAEKAEVIPLSPARLLYVTHAPFKGVGARPLSVWLPPGYESQPEKHWPVLYAQDGQNLFEADSSFIGVEWQLDECLTDLASEGFEVPIVIGIWNTPQRLQELAPQQALECCVTSEEGKKDLQRYQPLQGDRYLGWMADELKPWVDEQWRTLPDQEHTWLLGSSMGGLISCYALWQRPEIYGAAACVSTHWPAGDGALVNFLEQHPQKPQGHRLYFDHGDQTLDARYMPYQMRANLVLKQMGWQLEEDFKSIYFPGHEHSERSWSERVAEPMRFLLTPADKGGGN